MSISGIKTQAFLPIQPALPKAQGVPGAGTQGGSFGEALNDAIKEVDSLQKDADKQIEGLVLKADGATPHEAMVALEKADVAFQMMNQIRSKIIRAYEEVMRTQV